MAKQKRGKTSHPQTKSRILVSTLFVDLKINKKLKQILMFKTINNDNNDMA
jgi:hypothetical protein